jgi:hypothetical protein
MRFRLFPVPVQDNPLAEIELPAGWEPFQADRSGPGGTWVIYLRSIEEKPIVPL